MTQAVSPPVASSVSNLRAAVLVAVLLVYCVFAIVDRTMIAMLIDPIRETLGISDTQIGLLMGLAYAAAYGLGGLPMGHLVDRWPRRALLCAAVVLWGMAEAACGMASGFVGLFIARAAVGLFESPLHPSAHSMIADSVPRRRLSMYLSVYSTGNLIGTGLALAIGGWIVDSLLHLQRIHVPLLGEVLPWQFAFILTGLPGLLLAPLILLLPEPPRHPSHREAAVSWSQLTSFLRTRWQAVLCLAIVFGGLNIVLGGLIKWAPAHCGRHFHLHPSQYGPALGAAKSVPAVIGMLASGWLVDRWYARGRKDAHLTYYLWAIVLTAPLVFAGMMSDSFPVFLAGIALASGVTLNFLGIAAAQVQIIAPPALRGRLSGLFFLMVIAFLGLTFGALLPAVIAEHVLHDSTLVGQAIAWTLAIFAPLAVLAIVWGRPHIRAAIAAVEA